MKRLLVASLLLALPLAAVAHDGPHFDAKRLAEEVKVLSSDEFEGRGPATAGETKTIDYVVAQLKEAGASPGGDLKDGKRTHLRVHGKKGEPCPTCGTVIAEVSFADSFLNYCPGCQTGGKLLADRRMSKLLK